MRFNFVTSIVIVGLACMMLTSQAACDRRSPAEPAPGEGQAVIIPDTPELWHEFVVAIDWEVSREKSGGPPPGGVQSWTESWTGTLRGLRKGSQENPDKYVDYIIEARSAAGLPDLPKGTTAEPASGEGQAVIIPDTPELWREFVILTDWSISDEKAGEPPGGGRQSWTESWTRKLRGLRKGSQENPDKYVDYIIEARSAAGLPDLPKGTTAEPASGEGQAVIIPDTPELWYEFVVVTDVHVSVEKNGLAPPGGVQSWAKHWTDVLRHIAKARENPDKYVEYIIEARSAAGLPDLPHE